MSKHTHRKAPETRETMKGEHGRGQNTAGDREIMKGKHGRGQNTAGDHEITEPGSKRTK
jgi:hypothetical protein